jgi:hypothetical protein
MGETYALKTLSRRQFRARNQIRTKLPEFDRLQELNRGLAGAEDYGSLPSEFKGTSKVFRVRTIDDRRGLVFANLVQAGNALRLLEGGNLDRRFDVAGKIIEEAGARLRRGKYHEYFDHSAFGHFTEGFNKTDVTIEKSGECLVLSVFQVRGPEHSSPEGWFAAKLRARKALRGSSVDIEMAAINDWWYNIDLEGLLGRTLNLERGEIAALAGCLTAPQSRHLPEASIESGGTIFNAAFRLDGNLVVGLLRPYDLELPEHFAYALGTRVIGPAWASVCTDRFGYPRYPGRILPRLPRLSITLRPQDSPAGAPVTDARMIKLLQGARDELAGRICEAAAF